MCIGVGRVGCVQSGDEGPGRSRREQHGHEGKGHEEGSVRVR